MRVPDSRFASLRLSYPLRISFLPKFWDHLQNPVFVIDVLKIAVLVSSRISLKHHRLRLYTAQRPVISSSSRPISTESANSKAPPAGRTALWAEPPGPSERKLRRAYLPELVLINSGIHIILDSLSLCSSKLSYFSTAVT